MRQRCSQPVELPDRPLTQVEVEQFWARDRAALVKCGLTQASLATYYQALALSLAAADRSQ